MRINATILKSLNNPILLRGPKPINYVIKRASKTVISNKEEDVIKHLGKGLFLGGYIQISNDTTGTPPNCGIHLYLDGTLKDSLTIQELFDLRRNEATDQGAWVSRYDTSNGNYAIVWSFSRPQEFSQSLRIHLRNTDAKDHTINYEFLYLKL